MKKDYFKDGESAVDSILAQWETQIRKSKDESLNRTFLSTSRFFLRDLK